VNLANRSLRLGWVLAVLLLAACSSEPLMAPADLHPAGPPPDLATKMCVSSCTSDTQCQSTCASAPVGLNCCDQATHSCYVVANATCPQPIVDMTVAGPY